MKVGGEIIVRFILGDDRVIKKLIIHTNSRHQLVFTFEAHDIWNCGEFKLYFNIFTHPPEDFVFYPFAGGFYLLPIHRRI